ncbi:hypothetical protein [Kordia sp.]|uniref:hypothetical protein n=1 Tax=Kordia sp. TaxID=1965332 RepID=UPI003D6C6AED
MQLKKYLTLLSVFMLVCACKEIDPNKQIDEGNVTNEVYTSREIGWSILIPDGWEVISKAQSEKYTEKGKEAFKEVKGIEVDDSEVKDLISFKKNQFNLFLSNSEPFKETFKGEWKQNCSEAKSYIYDLYRSKRIKVDSSATTTARIDGFEFETYSITLYDPNDEVVLIQEVYNKLINGFILSVIINYNNEKDKRVMEKAFFDSQFRK